jgi:hypothetical protein
MVFKSQVRGALDMRTILIAHHDRAFSDQLAAELREGDLCQPYNLAVDSARAHPDVPMLLAWSPTDVPDAGTLRAITADAPGVHAAAREPVARLRQIKESLSSGSRLEMLR